MLKKLSCLISLAATLFTTSYATTRPCGCEFVIVGEYLALQPLLDNPYFVIDSSSADPTLQLGPRKANKLDFQSGFRIGAGYGLNDCGTDLRVSWIHVHGCNSQDFSGPFLHPVIAYPAVFNDDYENGTSTSEISMHFDRVELLLGQGIFDCYDLRLTFEAGLQFARLRSKNTVQYFTADLSDLVENKSRYWGVGPQVGLDLSYLIWNCFTVVATADAAILIGESKTSNFVFGDATNLVDVDNDVIWRIVPAFNTRVGLNYGYNLCWCGCRLNFNLEGGYQFLTYLRAFDTIEWVDDVIPSRSIDNYNNGSFHGPYISLAIRF